ncbi:MAG: SDR family oxidoreductase [Gammaproteobacteria bacterium]|nr:SDR family oxidoreductase [Gammaproteobacteria bacterium]
MKALDGKCVVVSGGGQGIGLGISRALLQAGAALIVVQRSPLAAELAAAGVQWIEADLAQADSYARVADTIGRDHDRIDALINNAGFMFEKTLEQMQLDDWNQMLAVNLTAPAFLSRALLPLLRAAGGGSIINIGSIEGLAANPEHTAYCASKGGVHALTKAMAVDLGSDGIRVNAIAPGWIRSDLSDGYINAQQDPESAWEGLYRMHPAGRVGEPEDVGQFAVYLACDASSFITGQVMVIDGGRTSKLPLPF